MTIDATRYLADVEIADSARKHGIADDDMVHAVAHAVLSTRQDDPERVLLIGPDRSGTAWLEVAVIDPDGDPAIIHAMPARPHLLQGLE